MRENRQSLMLTFLNYGTTSTSRPVYSLHPAGLEIGPVTAEAAIKSGELVPGDDGLLDGVCQTWRVR